ncbi:hypothetical protein [Azospirillum sp. ST 5-10]|uniref:hypothetical protein n=1 Tax=unclassified Azospirillum TaxID=2630922 RepID=UPI003F49FBCF
MRTFAFGVIVALLGTLCAPAAMAQSGTQRVVAVSGAATGLFNRIADGEFALSRMVPAGSIPLPSPVVEKDAVGYVAIQLGGDRVWLDETTVSLDPPNAVVVGPAGPCITKPTDYAALGGLGAKEKRRCP